MGFLRIDLGGMASGGFRCEGCEEGFVCGCSTAAVEMLYVISHTSGASHTAARHSWDRILSSRRRLQQQQQQTVTEPGCHWLVFLEGVCSVSLGIAQQDSNTHPPSATHTCIAATHVPRHPTAPPLLDLFFPSPSRRESLGVNISNHGQSSHRPSHPLLAVLLLSVSIL